MAPQRCWRWYAVAMLAVSLLVPIACASANGQRSRVAQWDAARTHGRDRIISSPSPTAFNDRFETGISRWLSQDEIDALPDNPVQMLAALQTLAGPGALVQVNGAATAMLPPKLRIHAIAISRYPLEPSVMTVVNVIAN